MAIPTNPILISDIIAEATSVENEDFLIIDQVGTHKKIAGTNFQSSGSSFWTKNIDDTLIYDTDVIAIGASTPANTDVVRVFGFTLSRSKLIRIQASAGISNQLIIKSNAEAGFSYGTASAAARFSESTSIVNNDFQIGSGRDEMLMKFAGGFFMNPFPIVDPADVGRIYKTGNVVKISL